jgi:hypothetical protein
MRIRWRTASSAFGYGFVVVLGGNGVIVITTRRQ